ncbi:hypothetical protein W97_02080 [Coniosporium apollinis CBS 100218]|uniref:Heterokaryon incompatibility domain-containing protein n=1 Tax=Coniosporium apollinis (strain CBS 100218) TaxID=1168221 RepID=R7YLR7_CONA1|nr:uncharacterized protein W97_02080 [Coniosporium apollinis CBS 100218]EON62855.1 hypothetical protein W97_02080 [Coniosporium apollinis CBS 100218]
MGVDPFTLYYYFWYGAEPDRGAYPDGGVDIEVLPAYDVEELFDSYELTGSTDAAATWSLVSKWIRNCATGHAKCGHINQQSWAPTRLLDVAAENSNEGLRLCELRGDLKGERYMTLSHCWGKTQPIRLLRGNLEAMLRSVSLKSLPKTFKDAIHITRRLGVKYLWIDAMCILQDSTTDWLSESALMEQVYRRSFCNIAASDAFDSDGGCYYTRNPYFIQPFWVDINNGSSPEQHCLVKSSPHWVTRLGRAPLNRRAWVIQERFLAPRALHLGKDQITWECRELIASESFPKGLPDTDLDFLYESLREIIAGAETFPNPSSTCSVHTKEGLIYAWNYLVDIYIRCDLTKPEDKLIAISGLATAMQRSLGTYLAGIWECSLPDGLLWTTVHPSRSRPSQYRAPSWSWASVEGLVHYYSTYAHELYWGYWVFILNAQVTAYGANGTGQVTAGSLRIQGRPALTRFSKKSEWPFAIASVRNPRGNELSMSAYFYPDGKDQAAMGEFTCLPIGVLTKGDSDPWLDEDDVDTDDVDTDDVDTDDVDTDDVDTDDVDTDDVGTDGAFLRLYGLVLQRETWCFKRVGVFILHNKHSAIFQSLPECAITIV